MSKERRRLYITDYEDGEYIVPFVANNSLAAKYMAMGHEHFEFCDNQFINIRVNWRKDIDASNYPLGELNWREALKLGVYSWYGEAKCEKCGNTADLFWAENMAICEDCDSELKNLTKTL